MGAADRAGPPQLEGALPLTPIQRYAAWTRPDGLPFDPWLRVHVRLGGRILRAEPESLRISGTVSEWEGWVGMAFPETGRYVFPEGLALLHVDRERDLGLYHEPNVWVAHDAQPTGGRAAQLRADIREVMRSPNAVRAGAPLSNMQQPTNQLVRAATRWTPVHLIPIRCIRTGSSSKRIDQRFRWSKAISWAWLDMNQRPHPY
jgi:hypothetical protein